jgi:ribulose-phosphate 3-epimerase
MKKKYVSPSFLSANFLNLQKDVEMINKSQADFIHLDVMDGVFVPNISFGFPIISAIKKIAQRPLDVHLMIKDADKYIDEFVNSGANILTVHYEACTHLHRTIQKIKSLGIKAGVSLNPHTSVSLLENIISELDLVLIMSVNPGYGGQKFIENTYNKISLLKKMIIAQKSSCLIEVDGGVTLENAKNLYDSGADILVAGSCVFNSKEPIETILLLKE